MKQKPTIKIIPSIASANPIAIQHEIDRLGDIGCLHLEIEDGNFCPSMTFGMDTIQAIANYTDFTLDAHLMVTNPLDYVDKLAECGIKSIAAHIEALPYPAKFLGKVQQFGIKAGLALNLKTSVDELLPFTSQLDYVLFLTNEPDFIGLEFRPYSFEKMQKAREILPAHIEIWADGGVKGKLLPKLAHCGVDTVIMGRAIFSSDSPQLAYERLSHPLSTEEGHQV